MARAGVAYVEIRPDLRPLDRELSARFSGGAWKRMGLVAGAGLAAGVGTGLFKLGKEFDNAFDAIRVGTGATGKQLGRLEGSFKKVIQDVPADFGSASTAIADLNTRLGLTGKPLQRMSKRMLELSRITETDVGTNVQAVTRAFGDWEVATGRQAGQLDKFFRASQASGASVQELAQQVVQFGAPLRQVGFSLDEATAMFAQFERAGVNTQTMMPGLKFALKSFLAEDLDPQKQLQKTFEGIEQGTIKTSDAMAIFGQRAGPDMVEAIQQGRFNLDKLTKTLKDGDDTVLKAAKDTEDFDEVWKKLTNRLAVQFEPTATAVFKSVAEEAKRFANIITDKRLTNDEKLSKVLDRLSDRFSEVMPELAENAAQAAPKVAAAFVRGFAAADTWGKLAIGGFLLAKFGGLGAFRKLGGTAGAAMGAGMATGAAGGAGGGAAAGGTLAAALGKGGKFGRLAKAGGIGVGLLLADQLLATFARRLESRGPDAFKALDAIKKGAPKLFGVGAEDVLGPMVGGKINELSSFNKEAAESAKRLSKTLRAVAEDGKRLTLPEAEKMRRDLRGLGVDSAAARKQMEALIDKGLNRGNDFLIAQQKVEAMARNSRGAIRGLRVKGSDDMDELVKTVLAGTKNMLRVGGDNSKRTREEVSKQFDLARDRIHEVFGGRDGIVQEGERGFARLRELAKKELGLYGISAGRVNVVLAKGASGEMRPNQRGGFIAEGKPVGDSVPALLERDEYVLNRNAVRKIGKRNLDKLNFEQAPRFQQGGAVRMQQGGATVMGARPGFVPIANAMLRLFGLRVSSGLRPGAITTSGNPSDHGWGGAIDINAFGPRPTPKSDAAHSWIRRHLAPAIKQMLYRTMVGGNHFDHIHLALLQRYADSPELVAKLIGDTAGGGGMGRLPRVMLEGPSSVALEAGQGALDRVRGAANARLAQVAGTLDPAAVGPGFSDSPWTEVMREIAERRGWSLSAWRTLVQRESGGDPSAVNPTSGAYGLGQFLGSTKEAYAKHGATSPDGADQIRAMAQYISDRYGNPSAALGFHNSNNWYAQGGLVRLAAGGDPHQFMPKGFAYDAAGGSWIDAKREGMQAMLRETLDRLSDTKRRKGRRRLTSRLLSQFGKLDLPDDVKARLKDLRINSNKFGDFADRAAALTDTGKIESALEEELKRRMAEGREFPEADQQAIVDEMLYRVGGRTEPDWLHAQLESLFNLRNALIRAESIAVQRRDETAKLTEKAKARLDSLKAVMRQASEKRDVATNAIKQLRGALDRELGKPKKKRDEGRIRLLREGLDRFRGQVQQIDERQRPRTRQRDALAKVVPALASRRSGLLDTRETLLGDLQEVQGFGPGELLARLPEIGALGGEILPVQLRLEELGVPLRVKAEDADTSAADDRLRELNELLSQELRESRLRTAVSQAQYDVLRNMPPYGGQFAEGGTVPGPVGAPRMILAHGGETVTPPGGGEPIKLDVTVIAHDGAVDTSKIEVIARQVTRDETRQQATRAARPAPGRAGVLA